MKKYLLKVENTYRVPTVEEALELRKSLEGISCGELASFSYTTKVIKVKGEVVEEYQLVKAKIIFDDEKDPVYDTEVSYERAGIEF